MKLPRLISKNAAPLSDPAILGGNLNAGSYNPVSIVAQPEVYPLTRTLVNVLNGQMVETSVTAGGTNYTAATTVTFPATPSGAAQRRWPFRSLLAVSSRQSTSPQWGTIYTPVIPLISGAALPAITITDSGGGTGATARAVMFNNVFNVVSISNIWGNQRYILRFSGFTLFHAYMRSRLSFYQRPTIWTIRPSNSTVIIQPPLDQPYQTEWDTLQTPIPLVNYILDFEIKILPPFTDAVKYYAAHYCLN